MIVLSAMPLDKLLLFTGAELVFSLTPGPTVMLISAYGFRTGWRDALAAIAGTQLGNTLWYGLCVAGLGAMVAASPLAFRLIGYAGAAYLIWIGAAQLWRSFKHQDDARGPRLAGRPFAQAVLNQLGNPKAILFFGALLPSCLTTSLPLGPQYAVMYAVTFIGESVILTFYAWLAVTGGRMTATHHAIWRERVSGAVLLTLGVLFAAGRT